MGLSVAVIGAGSSYCPELMRGVIRHSDALRIDELRLMDIHESRLTIVGGFCARALAAAGVNARVKLTTSLERAVENVDYVIVQIRAGRLEKRILDERIPLKYGLIGQETTGMGGFVNALRTIEQMNPIAKVVGELAGDAWLINFANPSGVVSEYLLNHAGLNAIGLCNLPISKAAFLAETLGVEASRIRLESASLNHCGLITAAFLDGADVLPQLLEEGNLTALAEGNDWVRTYLPLIRLLGGVPNDYLQYYFFGARKLREQTEADRTRGEICREIERELLEHYANEGNSAIPALLNKRGGRLYSEAAMALIASLAGAGDAYHVMDVQNRGTLDFLLDTDVIETCCLVQKQGYARVKLTKPVGEPIRSLLTSVKAYERLTVEAALTGSRDTAFRALMCNPLTNDLDRSAPCLDEMLLESRAFLPRFFA